VESHENSLICLVVRPLATRVTRRAALAIVELTIVCSAWGIDRSNGQELNAQFVQNLFPQTIQGELLVTTNKIDYYDF
jgi:negative regulator of sigma E activity